MSDAPPLIRNEARFRQRLLFNGLAEVMPGNLCPTDIDLVIERHSFVCFSDFKYTRRKFHPANCSAGQIRLWRTLVENCPEKHLFATCQHQVPVERDICALKDVTCFWLYVIRENGVGHDWTQVPAELWPVFVDNFTRKPRETVQLVRTGEADIALELLGLDSKILKPRK